MLEEKLPLPLHTIPDIETHFSCHAAVTPHVWGRWAGSLQFVCGISCVCVWRVLQSNFQVTLAQLTPVLLGNCWVSDGPLGHHTTYQPPYVCCSLLHVCSPFYISDIL
jgi:hypothetical protein